MPFPVHMVGRNNHIVQVTKNGEMAIGPVQPDISAFNDMDTINIAYNFYPPKSLQQFIITSILVFANKDVSDASATEIVIYEAESEDTTTEAHIHLQFGMGKLTVLPIVPLHLGVTPGLYLNAKTNDNEIKLTIIGHYAKV